MCKVAIVTIDSMNFGNRLQNYALQKVLESLQLQVETMRRGAYPSFQERLKSGIKSCGHKLLQTKYQKFCDFDKRIYKSKWYATANTAPVKLCETYDFFIAGSDQIWNPYYNFVGKTDLLAFANPEQKISYAASFGVDTIPLEKKEMYKEALSDFRAISVRESAGSEIVRNLTGRVAEIVLDPTLLLVEDDWMKVSKEPEIMPKEKYVLVYALGERSKLFQNAIQELSNEFEIFDILKQDKNNNFIAVGPSEFLYLIHNAEVILTDSYHATVFSILFNKNIMTFQRTGMNMNSRIITLTEATGLQNYMNFDKGLFAVMTKEAYREVEQNLVDEKQKSLEFLEKSIKV